MDKVLLRFWADAKRVSMTSAEKAEAKKAVVRLMSNAMPDDFVVIGKTIALTEAEKSEGKSMLIEMMRRAAPHARRTRSHWDWHLLFARKLTAATAAVAILVSVGSGAAYAAEDTVPGDLLYPMKIHVTEPLRERMYFDPQARAKWNEHRIDRRLNEAEILMRKHDAPEDALEVIRARVESQSARLEQDLASLSEGAPEELRLRMQERFDRHEEFLEALENGEVDSEAIVERARRHHERMRDFRGHKPGLFPPNPGEPFSRPHRDGHFLPQLRPMPDDQRGALPKRGRNP